MPTIFSLPYTIVFFFFILPSSSSSPPHSRRTLHQPLFSPAAHAPAHPPLVSFPKYPSSTNPLPFFPAFPSPPPPPPPPPASSTQTTSVPIFPATETPPTFSSPPSRRFLSQKLALAIAVPLSVIALLTISWALFTRLRHRHSGQKPSALETRRLFPGSAATATSGSVKLAGSSTGGFEYLAAAPPLLSSPELRPLPPLSHHRLRRNQDNAEIACPSSEEEFYSPRPSADREEKSGGAAARVGSTSRRSFPSALMEKCGLPSSALSSSSRSCCPSSYSLSSPSPSSPELSPPPGNSNLPPSPFLSPSPSPPPPPPPPPPPLPAARKLPSEPPVLSSPRTMIKEEEPAVRPKLKPLHWDKVRASSDRAMVWDQLRGGSFQVDEEMMEALFAGGGGGRVAAPSPGRERRLLDPKKSQNVAILLRVLNLTKEEVCRAVVEGDAESLGSELLETLLRMAPTGEEEARLRAEPEENAFKLDPAERFLIALLRIPFAFKRLEAMLYAAKFDSEAASLRESFRILLAAGEELRGSRMLRRLLEAVLKTGNRMNVGTSRGGARAFKLDTLLKLADVKSADGKTTLLHFVVQEIARAEGARLAGGAGGAMREELQRRRTGLHVVVGLGGELSSVKRAAAMDADLLRAGAAELAGGAAKVREVLRLDEVGGKFRETMEGFLERAEEETRKVEAEESAAMAAAAATAEYFHGSSDAAAPLRIFVVVRDFLAMLEKVCREVGRANDRALMAGSPRLAQPRFSPRERKEEEDDG